MLFALVSMLLLGALWMGVLGTGTFLTWRGWRGRPIDNLPRCRRCKYNVGGRASRPYRCPECGANLQLIGSVRLGAHRAHRPLVASGLGLLLLGVSPIGVLAWRAMPRVVPVAAAVTPGPTGNATAVRRRSVWNLSASPRAERIARARIASTFEDDEYGFFPAVDSQPTITAMGAGGLTGLIGDAGPRYAGVPDYNASFNSYAASSSVSLFTVSPGTDPAAVDEPAPTDADASPSARPLRSPWPNLAVGQNPWAGHLGRSGAIPGGDASATAGAAAFAPFSLGGQRSVVVTGGANLMPGRLARPQVLGGGGRTSDWRTGPQRFGGASLPIGANGLPTALPGVYRGGVSTGIPGAGLSGDLRLTQPAPVTSGLPEPPRLGR